MPGKSARAQSESVRFVPERFDGSEPDARGSLPQTIFRESRGVKGHQARRHTMLLPENPEVAFRSAAGVKNWSWSHEYCGIEEVSLSLPTSGSNRLFLLRNDFQFIRSKDLLDLVAGMNGPWANGIEFGIRLPVMESFARLARFFHRQRQIVMSVSVSRR